MAFIGPNDFVSNIKDKNLGYNSVFLRLIYENPANNRCPRQKEMRSLKTVT
jgi:hypothetical protein